MARIVASFILLLSLLLPAAVHADMQIDLAFDQKKRTAWVALPDKFDAFKKYPVVIVLHGGGGSGEQMRVLSEFDILGDKQGFIAVFPDGTPTLGTQLMTWNAGDCCGKAQQRDVDDVRFLDVLIDTVVRKYNGDPKRVYMTGHSNGGMMTYRYACVHPEKLAAIAVNAGQEWYRKCTETNRPVPILHIHGTEDHCANYEGGKRCGGCFADVLGTSGVNAVRQCFAVPDNMQAWARRYECNADTVPRPSIGAVSCKDWQGCKGGSSVRLCSIEGAGHSWPGGVREEPFCRRAPRSQKCKEWREMMGNVNMDISATAFIWDYFKEFSLP